MLLFILYAGFDSLFLSFILIELTKDKIEYFANNAG